MKKVTVSFFLLVVMLLAACSDKETVELAEAQASDEAVDVNVGLIMGPPSMGLGYFMNEAEQGNTYNNYNFDLAGVDYTAVVASLNSGEYDIATLPSNVAPIVYNNKNMKEDIKVISIGNLGLLYVLTTDPSISTMDDLKGRTVYSIGEGGPPEYTFNFVLQQAGLKEDVNFSFRATPFEVLNLLQEEENAVALLPQPFVEVAKLLVPNLRVAIDVTEAWDEVNKESEAESVITVTVVRKDFLEKHEQAVLEYLDMAKQSTDYTLANLSEAAAWTEKYETFLNPEIAEKAIPHSNIQTITGEEMKRTLSGFIDIMYGFDPEAVGGKIPDDDFYYIPEK